MLVSECITKAAEMVGEANEGRPAPVAYFAAGVALPHFNDMVLSWFGHGIGPSLQRMWTATAGSRAVNGGLYSVNVLLPEYPEDGWRIGATGAVTVTSSTYTGTIEGAANVTTTGAASWFYRADTSNWVLEEALTLPDTIYFPRDLVGGLPSLLAVRVLPAGYMGSEMLNAWAQVARQKFEQRYAPKITGQLDPGIQARVWNGSFFNINTGL